MAPGNAEREVQLRRDRLPGAAHLAFHGEPPRVANGARSGELGAKRRGQLLRHGQMLLPFDAAADGDDSLGLRQVDRLLRLLERRLRLLADRRGVNLHVERPIAAGDAPLAT